MKNYRFLMTMFALAALILTSCNKKQAATVSSADADSTTVVAPTEKSQTDKLTTKKIAKSLKNDAGEFDLTIDFPEGGNATLVNAIREYISESLGSTYGGGEEDTKQGSYSGDLADGDKMADYYFDLKVKEFQAMYNEMKQDGMPEIPELASSTKITKDYETDRVVTYLFNSYENGGGAHGGAVGSGMTFRKSDGRRVAWDMFSSGKMQTVLRDGLKPHRDLPAAHACHTTHLRQRWHHRHLPAIRDCSLCCRHALVRHSLQQSESHDEQHRKATYQLIIDN